MTPACSKRARTIESSISTPVAASTGGTACRPLFTATIGFFRATRRAIARELPWVAEALQIEKDHFGGLVGIPVLQKVVTRDVRTVTGGNEGGQSDSAASGFVENGDTERAGLTEEADVACHRQDPARASHSTKSPGRCSRHPAHSGR